MLLQKQEIVFHDHEKISVNRKGARNRQKDVVSWQGYLSTYYKYAHFSQYVKKNHEHGKNENEICKDFSIGKEKKKIYVYKLDFIKF